MRKRFERFCFRHRGKGIPNLMLYVVLGNAIVYLISLIKNDYLLYDILCFDRNLILQGQVWRLFSFIFTSFSRSNIFFTAISYLCYFSIGKAIENLWGTLRFNLFYLSGVILMAAFAMAFGGIYVPIDGILYDFSSLYWSMGTTLNLSLFLAYATLYPNTHFLLFFIIPVKAWIFAVIDLAITLWEIFSLSVPFFCFPHNLFPLVAIANYLLFFGKDVSNVFPISWQANFRRLFRKKRKQRNSDAPKTIPFPTAGSYQASTASVQAPYNHRCTVCGRTDVSDPDLEFRYCSRCNGYFCYCTDHISNHTHVE